MNKQAVVLAGMAFLGGAIATMVGTRVQGARAEVPGVAERLSYSGVLMQGTTPVSGSKTVRIRFFDAPVNGVALACMPPDTVVDLTKTAGHFHVNVSDCVEELEAAPDVFVEVSLEPGGEVFPPAGTGRPRVGAVPYAGQSLKSVASVSSQTAQRAAAADANCVNASCSEVQVVKHINVEPCFAGACNVTSSSGPWFTSVTRISVGRYDVAIAAGTFGATVAPNCVANGHVEPGDGPAFMLVGSSPTTVNVGIDDAAGAPHDGTFTMICVGSK